VQNSPGRRAPHQINARKVATGGVGAGLLSGACPTPIKKRSGERHLKRLDTILSFADIIFFDESKRKFAVRWLREKEIAREAREKAAHWYTKWTFFAAVAAVIVGIIGVLVTWYWH
jgi:hypothetical protein